MKLKLFLLFSLFIFMFVNYVSYIHYFVLETSFQLLSIIKT